jgi:hypothetical protein
MTRSRERPARFSLSRRLVLQQAGAASSARPSRRSAPIAAEADRTDRRLVLDKTS